jgi:hypothetical protein
MSTSGGRSERFNAGETGKHFDTGWGPAIGRGIRHRPNVGIQFEYAYKNATSTSATTRFAGASRFSANHQTSARFNIGQTWLILRSAPTSLRPGMYHRKVEITEYVGNGVICDPYWYVCGTYPC